jgi:hypothetical protein
MVQMKVARRKIVRAIQTQRNRFYQQQQDKENRRHLREGVGLAENTRAEIAQAG